MDYANTNISTYEMPFISVILPVFNCEKYVGFCIESILAQTHEKFELIIIDDGSNDSSGKICDCYTYDNRVHVFHQSNRGLSYARNLGCSKALGNYVVFVDSDDYIRKDYLECFVDIYCKTKGDIIIADFLRVDKQHVNAKKNKYIEYYNITSYEAIEKLFSDGHDEFRYGTAWGKMFNIKLLNKYPFPIDKYWEDVFVLYKLYNDANNIVILNEVTYYYFKNDNSITNSPFGVRNLDYLEGMEERLKFIKIYHGKLYESALKSYIRKCTEYLKEAKKISDEFIVKNIENRLIANTACN